MRHTPCAGVGKVKEEFLASRNVIGAITPDHTALYSVLKAHGAGSITRKDALCVQLHQGTLAHRAI